jgi:hypothetical protein
MVDEGELVDFIKTSAVARLLDKSENYVRRLADAGVLPVAAKLSDGTRLFSPVDVERVRREREARRVAQQQPQPAPAASSAIDDASRMQDGLKVKTLTGTEEQPA